MFVDALQLRPDHRVLEIACGTGRDSEIIADRLGSAAQYCLQDIAPSMLRWCRKRLRARGVPKSFCVSNACYLPYPDRTFDAIYSFGALGEFSNIKQALAEMVRVSTVGTRIVVGDESIPPWLRHTAFARILSTTNAQLRAA